MSQQPDTNESNRSLKPIRTWGNRGPNPMKIQMILGELCVPYEVEPMDLADVKSPAFLAVNPNGRVPAIHDPNTGITLWESGAIILYLVSRYDHARALSFVSGTVEAELAQQWLFFQTSGQGPYFGQVTWFRKYHPERVPSAEERYIKEVNRVTGVLDAWLTRQKADSSAGGPTDGDNGPWLVGNKLSYADVSFVQWSVALGNFCSKEEVNYDNFPVFKEWLMKLKQRPVIREVLERSGQR